MHEGLRHILGPILVIFESTFQKMDDFRKSKKNNSPISSVLGDHGQFVLIESQVPLF